MCLYTKYIVNPKYVGNKKNDYNPPKCTDMRLYFVPTKCGRCIECRREKKRNWMIRLNEEIRNNKRLPLFVTLTFNDIEYDKLAKELFKTTHLNNEERNELCTKAVRRFLELIRKYTKKMQKHWFITEVGDDFDRIHLHGIMWSEKKWVEKWKYGYYFIGNYVNEKTINYITKYMLKVPEKNKTFIGKVLASPGIGKGYIKRIDSINNKYKESGTNEMYRTRKGMKLPLPQYYRDQIYTDEEKEKLWIEKQEQGFRYIGGEKVEIDDEEKYNAILQYYQRKGRELYGDNPEEWDAAKQRKRLNKMREYRRKAVNNLNKAVNK